MKKVFNCCMLVLLVLMIGGCSVQKKETQAEIHVGQTVSFPKLEIFDYSVKQIEKIKVVSSADENKKDVFLLVKEEEQSYFHTTKLVIQTSADSLLYEFQNSALDELLYTADVNGDGLEEIIIHRHLDDFGGAGQYCSYVLQVNNNAIETLFCSVVSHEGDCEIFDTGFSCAPLENYQMKIANNITGKMTIIDISNRYLSDAFTDSGKLTFSPDLMCDSFFEFYPNDVDGDGVLEIVGTQYAYLDIHGSGLGSASVVLKFNSSQKEFEVIDSSFEPA